MRFILLTLGILLAVPAYAADSNPVITINPDGSVTVIGDMPQPVTDMQAPPPVPDPAPAAVEIVSPVEEFAATPAVATAVVQPVLVPPPVPKVKPPAPVRQAKKKAPAPTVAAAKPEPSPLPQDDGVSMVISREDARRIALSVAPPSRGVDVYPADYNGLKVFQVVFKTEEGEQYVLVDRLSGEIVKDKKRKQK